MLSGGECLDIRRRVFEHMEKSVWTYGEECLNKLELLGIEGNKHRSGGTCRSLIHRIMALDTSAGSSNGTLRLLQAKNGSVPILTELSDP
jgi:hypothetical protein